MTTATATLPTQAEATALLCRQSFWKFCQEFWSEVPGAGVMAPNWHMKLIARELQNVAERVFKSEPALYDEVFNISPGTSKSTICSILFPAWTWTRMPEARHICASHTDALVLDLSNKCRIVIKSDKYRACFPEIEASESQDTKGYFFNTQGGGRLSATVGGKSPTGFHAHFLTGDDLIDPQKALSEAEVKTAAEFISNILPTRMVNKLVSVMFLVMQRLGPGDPTDVMLEIAKREGARPVRHVCLPAELSDDVSPRNSANAILGSTKTPKLTLTASWIPIACPRTS
jgi:hypothetical protein